eukprot:COSAG02_NODE_185_length_30442_cov_59.370168_13_plen_285_part_00
MASLRAGTLALLSVVAPVSTQMVHGTKLPKWEPTYQMNQSTASTTTADTLMQFLASRCPHQLTLCRAAQFLMACNNTGPFTTEFAAKWGIADFDWSNWVHGANQTWDGEQYGGYSEQVPETCQQNLRVQAAMTKAANNNTKVFVYRNMVKALPWYKSVREKLVDPDYSGFFLPFKCNASASDPKVIPGEDGCHVPRQGSALYHDQEQTIHGKTCPTDGTGSQACCGVPCGECRRSQRCCSKITIFDCLKCLLSQMYSITETVRCCGNGSLMNSLVAKTGSIRPT